jgi:hypothetical protein
MESKPGRDGPQPLRENSIRVMKMPLKRVEAE